jgi:adenosylcobinamide kinase/adenosylcobinamide-phosphate guanylyltransferase
MVTKLIFETATEIHARSLLVLGGARSGKSRYAQRLAESCGRRPVLIATAEARDLEMQERIARHKAERGSLWDVVEEPFALTETLRREGREDRLLVVDCTTLWLSNLLLRGESLDAASAELASGVVNLAGPVIFVSNEVGLGIVPDNSLARAFRDAQGWLNQALAEACDAVVLVNAGLPVLLKPAPALKLRL